MQSARRARSRASSRRGVALMLPRLRDPENLGPDADDVLDLAILRLMLEK